MYKEKVERNIRDYLNDILEMIKNISNFTNEVSYEDLEKDIKTQCAVIRCLEVLGEAVKKIPKSMRKRYPEVSWQEIAGIRDKLIHEYFGVDMEVVWDTIQEDLTPLKITVKKMINDLYKNHKK